MSTEELIMRTEDGGLGDGKRKLANNNDKTFESKYLQSKEEDEDRALENGRISGGSEDSAYSLASAESDDCISEASNSGSSNTSHSVDESSPSSTHQTIHVYTNLMPEIKAALALVEQVRLNFLDACSKNDVDENADDLYDCVDLEELKKPLPALGEQEKSLAFRLISRYLNFQKILSKEDNKEDNNQQEINSALESLIELLKYRKHYKLSHVLPEQFSKEFYILSGIFQFGHDRQQLPVLYLRARVHRRWSQPLDETFRRYVAWQLDQITKSQPSENVSKTIGLRGSEKDGSFGICFDCLSVSYSCLDMDFLRFLVRLLVNYYPTYCRYALCVDLPWLFRSVWKLVRSWLPEEAQNNVQLITSKQLTDFIDENQIPNSMKHALNKNNSNSKSEKKLTGKHQFPNNFRSIKGADELGKELNLSSSEIKQFKTHVDKIQKEYEQMEAI